MNVTEKENSTDSWMVLDLSTTSPTLVTPSAPLTTIATSEEADAIIPVVESGFTPSNFFFTPHQPVSESEGVPDSKIDSSSPSVQEEPPILDMDPFLLIDNITTDGNSLIPEDPNSNEVDLQDTQEHGTDSHFGVFVDEPVEVSTDMPATTVFPGEEEEERVETDIAAVSLLDADLADMSDNRADNSTLEESVTEAWELRDVATMKEIFTTEDVDQFL
ncbi:hypothetical protein SK128_022495 [Halocaridina rubra]|uniref:Uncharacterized protein n=1 Tax=Halocaridina rubra TaxID=373956 RepID=A0AAN9A2F0_HALRR